MRPTTAGTTSWRRALMILFAALVAIAATSFLAPSSAHAIRNPNAVLPSHTGWVYVKSLTTSSPDMFCTAVYPSTCSGSGVQTWWWNGKWNSWTIVTGTQVYAFPYAGAYHWIWTSRTGWLAIRTANLDTGYSCTGPVCPQF